MSDERKEALKFINLVRSIRGKGFPVTYYAHNHASAVAALAKSWEVAGEVSGIAALKSLPGLNFKGATNIETIDSESQHSSLNMLIAQGNLNNLKIISRVGSLKSNAGCVVQNYS